jgi:adenine-specific DNA-methyltransferase
VPEAVELPGRKVRKGEKVRILPPRGREPRKADETLWRVLAIDRSAGLATLEPLVAPVPDVEVLVPDSDAAPGEAKTAPTEDLIVVAEFRDPIYPGLVPTGKVERGGDKPFHTVINAENFHALQALLFTHEGRVDAIYIDPPYNSGARDWKYNNDYVEKEDLYRHSKWLAFMERRLHLARKLLNPEASALVCAIDEKEFLNLGLLIKQVFPEARIQMVSSLINAKGIIRDNEFSRTNEFLFFAFLGRHRITPEQKEVSGDKVRWASLRRSDVESARGTPKGGPEQFYPIYVNEATGRIERVGVPLKPDEPAASAPDVEGCVTVLPVREKGEVREMNWGLTVPTLEARLERGFVKAVISGKKKRKVTLYYLTSGLIDDVEAGNIVVDRYEASGAAVVRYADGKRSNPTTQWAKAAHNAQSHGSEMLRELIPGRGFPYPKSLYAVEDAWRIVVGENKEAVVLDYFSGSGTTAHALFRLNRQDGGRRQCISITNNEVAAAEQEELRREKLRPGDADWEKRGICQYITEPRIEASVTGRTPEGEPVKGDYKFVDEFPMAEGFEENVEFFTLSYEAPLRVSSNREFARIAPLLWLRAGSVGRRIDDSSAGWEVADVYGVLADLDYTQDFLAAVSARDTVSVVFIVTDEERLFESVAQQLPATVEPVRLYEAYLRNFEIESGRGLL